MGFGLEKGLSWNILIRPTEWDPYITLVEVVAFRVAGAGCEES